MKRTKQLLAFLLATMLLLTMIPISASAADEEVNIVRLMNRDEWREATYKRDGTGIGVFSDIQRIFLFDKDGNQLGLGDGTGVVGSDGGWFRTYISTEGHTIDPKIISKIVLMFTNKDKWINGKTTTVSAVFHEGEFEIGDVSGSSGIKYAEIRLTNTGKQVPDGHRVRFFAELNDEATYSLYDTIYVPHGEEIGDRMPPNPPIGGYEFHGWSYGDITVSAGTTVTQDMDVYADKGTGGGGNSQEYRVMSATEERPYALLEEVADQYNEDYDDNLPATDFVIQHIRVDGEDGESTNLYYSQNRWENNGEYYYIYNLDRDPIEVIPEYHNVRVDRDEVTGITIEATIRGQDKPVRVSIPESELYIVEGSGGTENRVLEIRVAEKIDGITKTLVTTADENYPQSTIAYIPEEGTTSITVKDGESITLMYKLTVTGDKGSAYKITDAEATAIEGTLEGIIGSDGIAVVYVTKTFTSNDAENGSLINSATVSSGNTDTLGPDGGNDSDEVEIDAEVEGDEEGKPDEPDEGTLTDLLEDQIKVQCEDDESHTKDYGYLEDGITVGDVEKEDDGSYTCELTVDAAKYNTEYNLDESAPGYGKDHSLAEDQAENPTITLIYENDVWSIKDAVKDTPAVTINVTCKDGGGEPGPGPDEPTPPTDEELEELLDGKITVKCTNDKTPEHGEKKYGLLEGSYDVDLDEDGDTCTITIRAGDYIVEYNKDINKPDLPHGLVDYDNGRTATIKLTHNGTAWEPAADEDGKVTFQVKCGSTIVEVPGEGERYPVYVEPEDPTDPDQTGVADLLETDDHIQYLFGYPDDSFGPDRNMTRAEAAQMFYNLLKNKNVDAEPAFDDVPVGAWYATPVNVMAELGIVDGVGDDKFEPNREITRAEFTTMAMRFADVPSGGVNIFTDVNPDDWFYSYVVNSIQYGWIEGYGDGTFRPDRLITRAEVTTIVNRMLDRQADMAYVIQHRAELNQFTDLTTEHWAYYTIVEATNEHNYKKPAIGEDWTSLK